MIDTIDVDDPKNILNSEVQQELRQKELVDIVEDNVRKQYEKLENLGQDYFGMFDAELRDEDKARILTDLVVYVDRNYLPIVDLDNLDGDTERLLTAGSYI